MEEILLAWPILTYIVVFVISLAIGSFLNVIIYRIPLMIQAEWRADCQALLQLPANSPEKIDLFHPRRSFCPNCQTIIKWWHNIPLLSYIMLLGRCAYCGSKISLQYPLVEFLTACAAIVSLLIFGLTLKACALIVFFWFLIVLCFIDLKHQILPDSFNLGLLWLGLIFNIQNLFVPLSEAVISAVIGYLILWVFIQLFYLVTGKIGMGNGDFKLFAAFGAWFGYLSLPFIIITSSLIGAITGITYLAISKQGKETPIPFGPFLCLAAVIYVFFGEKIIAWYLGLYI